MRGFVAGALVAGTLVTGIVFAALIVHSLNRQISAMSAERSDLDVAFKERSALLAELHAKSLKLHEQQLAALARIKELESRIGTGAELTADDRRAMEQASAARDKLVDAAQAREQAALDRCKALHGVAVMGYTTKDGPGIPVVCLTGKVQEFVVDPEWPR